MMEYNSDYKRCLFPKLHPPQVSFGHGKITKKRSNGKLLNFTISNEFEKSSEETDVNRMDCSNESATVAPKPNDSFSVVDTMHVLCPKISRLKLDRKTSFERTKVASINLYKMRSMQNKNKSSKVKRLDGTQRQKIFKRTPNLPKTKKKSAKLAYKVNQKRVVRKMKPRNIMFNRHFTSKFAGINKSIYDTLQELKSGTLSIEDIPKITVYRWNGKTYTINNRRLWVFKSFSAYYRKAHGRDLMVPVVFLEKLNLVRVSRTVGVPPVYISHFKVHEKKQCTYRMAHKLNLRSKKGNTRMTVLNGQPRMRKADIQRIKKGDDFELFSVTKTATDFEQNDFENDQGGLVHRKVFMQLPRLGDYIEKFIGDKLH